MFIHFMFTREIIGVEHRLCSYKKKEEEKEEVEKKIEKEKEE